MYIFVGLEGDINASQGLSRLVHRFGLLDQFEERLLTGCAQVDLLGQDVFEPLFQPHITHNFFQRFHHFSITFLDPDFPAHKFLLQLHEPLKRQRGACVLLPRKCAFEQWCFSVIKVLLLPDTEPAHLCLLHWYQMRKFWLQSKRLRFQVIPWQGLRLGQDRFLL